MIAPPSGAQGTLSEAYTGDGSMVNSGRFDGMSAPDEAFERAAVPEPERDRELAEALRRLPPRRKLVVFLRHFADLSYAEIAELCEISEGTVAATLARAHADLAKALTREGARP